MSEEHIHDDNSHDSDPDHCVPCCCQRITRLQGELKAEKEQTQICLLKERDALLGLEDAVKEISRLKAEVAAWKVKFVLQRTTDLLEGFRDGKKHGFGIGIKFAKRHDRATYRAAAEGMAKYTDHTNRCIRHFEEAGEPTPDGGYRLKILGKWYQSKPFDETPKCDCGLGDLLAAWSKVSGEVK